MNTGIPRNNNDGVYDSYEQAQADGISLREGHQIRIKSPQTSAAVVTEITAYPISGTTPQLYIKPDADGGTGGDEIKITTEGLIASSELAGKPVGYTLSTTGYRTAGDKGWGTWVKTSETGTASQGPDVTGDAELFDGNGDKWELITYPIPADALGCIDDYSVIFRSGTNNDLFLKAFYNAARGKEGIFRGQYYFVDGGTGHEVTSPTKLRGIGQRFGTIVYYGSVGTKSVKTFRKHPDDGADDPISTAFHVRADNVDIQDFVVSNVFDTSNPNDYGSEWDVGFLVDEGFFTTDRVRAVGYWRKHGLLYNVTLPNGNCDGSTLKDSWFQGFWGGSALGPLPKSGDTEIQPGDNRGAGGMSDFVCLGSTRFLDMHHHSKVRLSDTDGGAWWIDGYLNTPAGGLQGHNYNSTRFQSASLFSIKVGRSSRDNFDKTHTERSTGYFKADGVTPANDTHIDVSTESRRCKFSKSIWLNQATNVFDGSDMAFLDNDEGDSNGINPYYHTIPFTPSISCSTSGVIPGHSVQQGYYRVDNGILTFVLRCQASDITGANGNVSIVNLPKKITDLAFSHSGFPIMTFNVAMGAVGIGPVQGLISPDSDKLDLYVTRDGSGTTTLKEAELLSNSMFQVTATILINEQQ